jgi:MFS transporter, FHS family, glucose/mannose:H+ symporter
LWLRLTRVSPPLLAVGSLLVAAAGLGLAHVPALAPAAYTLTGLALGPVFPTVLAWLAAAAPGARGTTALVFATAQVGGLVLPLAIGRLVDASTPAVIPTTILVVALACLGATLLLRRSAAHAL